MHEFNARKIKYWVRGQKCLTKGHVICRNGSNGFAVQTSLTHTDKDLYLLKLKGTAVPEKSLQRSFSTNYNWDSARLKILVLGRI